MERHLKEFNSNEEYEDYMEEHEIEGPYVFYMKDSHVIYSGIEKIKLVDMGLPSGTLWAAEPMKNENGDVLYFAWGETSGYTAEQVGVDRYFYSTDYKFYSNGNYTKYNDTDGLHELEAEDDAATQILGADYQIPSVGHWCELLENCYINFICLDDGNDNSYDDSYFELESKINGNKIILNQYSCLDGGYIMEPAYYYSGFYFQTNTKRDVSSLYVYIQFYCSGEHVYPFDYCTDNSINNDCGISIQHGTSRINGVCIYPIKKGSYIPEEPQLPVAK